jgi:methyl-accepting chemotaxis protein
MSRAAVSSNAPSLINVIRHQAQLFFIGLFWAGVPAVAATSWLNGHNPLLATTASLLVAALASLAKGMKMARPGIEYLYAVLAVLQASILVAAGDGAWQIDFHFFYFALLAMLTAFCNWRVILVAAGVTAVHHLTLSFTLPNLVFAGGTGSFLRVLFHAVVVIMETGLLIWLSWNLDRSFRYSETARDEAERLAAEAEALRRAHAEQETAQRDRDAALRKQLADRFVADVDGMTKRLDAAVRALRGDASALGETVGATEAQTGAARAQAEDATGHAASVAAAVEEMAASIAVVAQTVTGTAGQARQTADQAKRVERQVAELSEVAARIGSVVQLIADIAGQTNLLALNATIEAARAGEAGKGFAVVASEVKNLATQTAKATEDISAQVTEIQSATQAAVSAMAGIARSIASLDEGAEEIVNAIHQQEATVTEISSSIQKVSTRTSDLSEVIGSMADVAMRISQAVGRTDAAAADAESLSADLNVRLDAFVGDLRKMA